MITKIFRVKKGLGYTSWTGLVYGRNMEAIFWAIDEFIDPYAVEIASPRYAGGIASSIRNLKSLESLIQNF